MRKNKENQGDVITVTLQSSDKVINLVTDGRAWFTNAKDKSIDALTLTDDGDNYTGTDEIFAYLQGNEDASAKALVRYLEQNPSAQAIVLVNKQEALAWMKSFKYWSWVGVVADQMQRDFPDGEGRLDQLVDDTTDELIREEIHDFDLGYDEDEESDDQDEWAFNDRESAIEDERRDEAALVNAGGVAQQVSWLLEHGHDEQGLRNILNGYSRSWPGF